jgi:hypothetical protein
MRNPGVVSKESPACAEGEKANGSAVISLARAVVRIPGSCFRATPDQDDAGPSKSDPALSLCDVPPAAWRARANYFVLASGRAAVGIRDVGKRSLTFGMTALVELLFR